MPLPFRLHLRRLRFRLARFLSADYRILADLSSALSTERASHQTTTAKLAVAQDDLTAARSQIQSLTISAQSAASDAARWRTAAEESREREAESLRLLASKLDPIVDVLALRVIGRQVYGTLADEAFHQAAPPPEHILSRGVPAKHVARETTRSTLEFLQKSQEAEMAQQRAREERLDREYSTANPTAPTTQ